MLKSNAIRNATLVLLLVALLLGVIQLFVLRFQAGDIYPAYSSLRSDPLGTRVFYESLANFEHISRQRNYQPLESMKSDAQAVFLYFGAKIPRSDSIPEKTAQVLDRLTASGGRLIFTYLPAYPKDDDGSSPEDQPNGCQAADSQPTGDSPHPAHSPQKDAATEPQPSCDESKELPAGPAASESEFVSIREHWGVEFRYADLPEGSDTEKKPPVFEANSRHPNLPAAVSWHSSLYFQLQDENWRIIYAVAGKPVIIERAMGLGSIVLCADSFFISNEAMRSERHPQLLAWLLGGQATVIFDESHFGIYKVPGVAGLLRRYRFQWFFAALAVVALLFVWKNTAYFVPPPKEDPTGDLETVSAKDYSRGLIALLRRNINRTEILQVCGREWEQTFKSDQRIKPDAIEQMKRILQPESPASAKRPDPVRGYRRISRLLERMGSYTIRGQGL